MPPAWTRPKLPQTWLDLLADTLRQQAGAVRTAAMVLVSDPLLDPSAATVVRVRMPRSALATLGLPLVEPDGGGAVDLEMIVGEDGIARTIQRAVPVSTPGLQE